MERDVRKYIAGLYDQYFDEELLESAINQYQYASDGKKGKKQREKAVKKIVEQILGMSKYVTDMEIESAQRMSGMIEADILTTDTKGSRSIKQLREGRPFATGIATRCITIAIIHDEVGMGASHRNTVDKKVVERFVKKNLEDPTLEEEFANMSWEDISMLVTPPNLLRQTMATTFDESIQEFRSLIPGRSLPSGGIKILAAGMDFLSGSEALAMDDTLIDILHRHPSFNDGSMQGGGRKIELSAKFGDPGGIIWGGPDHPQYHTPGIYRIEYK